jgi:hypothetical protein
MVIHQERTCKILFPLPREFLNGLPGQVPNGPTTAHNVLSSRVFPQAVGWNHWVRFR